MSRISNKDELIVAVGNAMENYINGFAAGWYIDYTDQTVVMIEDYIFELDDNKKSDVSWEKEMIHSLHVFLKPVKSISYLIGMLFYFCSLHVVCGNPSN